MMAMAQFSIYVLRKGILYVRGVMVHVVDVLGQMAMPLYVLHAAEKYEPWYLNINGNM